MADQSKVEISREEGGKDPIWKSKSAKHYLDLKRITVEPVTFCYACALILHMPLIQQFVYQRISEQRGIKTTMYENDKSSACESPSTDVHEQETRNDVQALTAYIHLGVILSASLPSLFTSLLWGTWSDKVGRKVILLLPVAGGAIDSICIIVTIYARLPLYYLFIGGFIHGICGFFTTMILAVFAYIADITSEQSRATRLGVIEAVAFISGMTSHLTSGWWIRHLGFMAPYLFILALHTFSLGYIICVLPESMQNREKYSFKGLFTSNHLTRVFKIFKSATEHIQKLLFGLLLTSAVMMTTSIGFGSVIVLYTLDAPFCFSPIMIGYFLACSMFTQAIGALFALFVLSKCFSEIMLTQIGFLSIIGSLVMLALIKEKSLTFVVPLVGSFGAVCMPIIRAKMSKLIAPEDQGTLFAAVATLETLCTLLGAAVFNSLYPYSVTHLQFKGFSFLVMAATMLIPCITMCWVSVYESKITTTVPNDDVAD